MEAKSNLHEGQQLQCGILRIDAERRRLGLSLRQADELDAEQPAAETFEDETVAGAPEKPSATNDDVAREYRSSS